MASDIASNLAIVSSPLQYMNAVEWRSSAGDVSCDLVVIGDRHASRSAIDGLMRRLSPWRAVFWHGRRPRLRGIAPRLLRDLLDAGHRASLDRLARRLVGRGYAAVAIGDYRNVSQRLLLDRLGVAEAVLLDDGSVTPQAAAFRRDPTTAPEPRQFDLSWFRTALARRWLGDRAMPEPDRVAFFSIYGALLEGRLAASDRIIGHDYPNWRAAAPTTVVRGGGAWLIGSDHAEAGICTQADYRALVLAAALRLKEEGRDPVVYRPHRGEARAKAEALARVGGMAFGPSTAPAELDYVEAGERPATVAVIASSVADTLAVLDPMLDIVRIAQPSAYLRKRAEHIRAVVAAHHAFNPRLRVVDPGSRRAIS